jgi:tRNA G18 (ribose-2'-O)-methylase SpoU
MPLIQVHEIDDPRLAHYRDLNQRNLTRQSGLFIAEGEKVAERLVASRYEVVSILAEPAYAQRYEARVPPDVPIYVAPRNLLAQTVGFHFHRGIVACGRRQAGIGIVDLPTIRGGTVVVCPDVQDPTNLGSIIRSTAAFGCSAIVLGPKCADPFSRRVLRVSMGAALHLPVVESPELGADLRELGAAGFELVAAVIDPSAEPLSSFQSGQRTAILFGSEGHGLAEDWLALSHRRVTIPMQLGIDSLNVAVAAAVVLYELTRHTSPKRERG